MHFSAFHQFKITAKTLIYILILTIHIYSLSFSLFFLYLLSIFFLYFFYFVHLMFIIVATVLFIFCNNIFTL